MRLPLAGSVTPMLLLWSRAIWLSASSVDMLAGAVYTLPCRGENRAASRDGSSQMMMFSIDQRIKLARSAP
jgi:hypothetical protein